MEEGQVDFNSLIASSIHDMKNSLSLIIHALDERAQEAHLQCEAKRLNSKLIQLLCFYKMDKAMLSANREEWCVYDLLTELLLQETPLLEARDIEGELHCDEGLAWVFDRELVSGALGNALNNAIRHARHRLVLAAHCEGGELIISIQDDGDGFPVGMLENIASHRQNVSFSHGNTGLGLYFSHTIASMHRRDGRTGRVCLSNPGETGGACFSLILP